MIETQQQRDLLRKQIEAFERSLAKLPKPGVPEILARAAKGQLKALIDDLKRELEEFSRGAGGRY